jgi:PAS domain S-box-containing protein
LKEAEEKYRGIFEGALEGIFESSPEGKLLTANATLSRMLGYDSPEELTSSIRDLGKEVWVNEHERAEYVQRLEKREVILNYECQFRRRDGTAICVSLSSQRVTSPEGQTVYYSGFIENITERKQMELESRKLKDDLAHVTRVSTLGGLTSSLAHEINQPLTAILSNAQAAHRFLLQDHPDMKEISEILGDIIRDDNRAAEVIRKIRSLLKKEELRYESLSLNDVIEEILNVIRNDTALTAVSIEKEFDPSLTPIWGDRIQLQQVILNLILNAAEAMRDTSIDPRRLIVRTSKKDGRFAEVAIRDVGTGIKENNAGRLFDSFYTTKSGGLGMGLAISKDIVKSHKGEIRAENNPDIGATFSFTVPFDNGVRL